MTSTDEQNTNTLIDFKLYKLDQLDYDQIQRYLDDSGLLNKEDFNREVSRKQEASCWKRIIIFWSFSDRGPVQG